MEQIIIKHQIINIDFPSTHSRVSVCIQVEHISGQSSFQSGFCMITFQHIPVCLLTELAPTWDTLTAPELMAPLINRARKADE